MKAKNKELLLLPLVGSELRIDPDGSVWRIATCTGGRSGGGRAPIRPIVPRRVEQFEKDGYARAQGNPGGGGTLRVLAHRLVWVYFNGPIPAGMQINHKNGVKGDNRPENLEVVTPRGNVRHRSDVLGHKPPGGYMVGSVKLTETNVREIRAAYGAGVRSTVLAAKYGVIPQTIEFAAKGKTWRHIASLRPAPAAPPQPPSGERSGAGQEGPEARAQRPQEEP